MGPRGSFTSTNAISAQLSTISVTLCYFPGKSWTLGHFGHVGILVTEIRHGKPDKLQYLAYGQGEGTVQHSLDNRRDLNAQDLLKREENLYGGVIKIQMPLFSGSGIEKAQEKYGRDVFLEKEKEKYRIVANNCANAVLDYFEQARYVEKSPKSKRVLEGLENAIRELNTQSEKYHNLAIEIEGKIVGVKKAIESLKKENKSEKISSLINAKKFLEEAEKKHEAYLGKAKESQEKLQKYKKMLAKQKITVPNKTAWGLQPKEIAILACNIVQSHLKEERSKIVENTKQDEKQTGQEKLISLLDNDIKKLETHITLFRIENKISDDAYDPSAIPTEIQSAKDFLAEMRKKFLSFAGKWNELSQSETYKEFLAKYVTVTGNPKNDLDDYTHCLPLSISKKDGAANKNLESAVPTLQTKNSH